ncbi:hypothetical protein GRU3_19 [Gordonia phage GRU3]|uniref:Uncharacterized protein n=1 Tax=Gordonia phage GRU3 TaxID=1647473 RepID=A0A0K0N689_9CAUD|nr:hypothetical protein BH785_gp19 [Gordonia phage GRU3]AKJ72268.1 hypothetical protein GRU3_19 [Gordonia phage GRU3]
MSESSDTRLSQGLNGVTIEHIRADWTRQLVCRDTSRRGQAL